MGFYKYLLLLIPIPAFLLFTEMQNQHSLFFNSKTLGSFPLAGLGLVFIMTYFKEQDELVFYSGKNIFSMVDIGFWPILVFSVLLIFTVFEKKAEKQYA
jgi:hypothetical protein